jgi:hypothetical protein
LSRQQNLTLKFSHLAGKNGGRDHQEPAGSIESFARESAIAIDVGRSFPPGKKNGAGGAGV